MGIPLCLKCWRYNNIKTCGWSSCFGLYSDKKSENQKHWKELLPVVALYQVPNIELFKQMSKVKMVWEWTYWHKFYIRRKLCTLVIVGPYVMFCNMIKRPPWHFISIVQQSCSFRRHWSGHYNLNELCSTFHFFVLLYLDKIWFLRDRGFFVNFYLLKNITHNPCHCNMLITLMKLWQHW